MTENQFWELISLIDVEALTSGEEDESVQPLVESLANLQPHEMEQFDEQLARRLYELDGKAYAAHAGESGRSGDGFLYARCFVVASGKEFYDQVLADPSRFPSSIDQWCEPLLYVAAHAWSQATGNPEEDWNYITAVSYETGSNRERWTP